MEGYGIAQKIRNNSEKLTEIFVMKSMQKESVIVPVISPSQNNVLYFYI